MTSKEKLCFDKGTNICVSTCGSDAKRLSGLDDFSVSTCSYRRCTEASSLAWTPQSHIPLEGNAGDNKPSEILRCTCHICFRTHALTSPPKVQRGRTAMDNQRQTPQRVVLNSEYCRLILFILNICHISSKRPFTPLESQHDSS